MRLIRIICNILLPSLKISRHMNYCTKMEGLVWNDAHLPVSHLRLHTTLNMGQCFQWKGKLIETTPIVESNGSEKMSVVYMGVLDENVYLLKQDDSRTYVSTVTSKNKSTLEIDQIHRNLHDYFQMDIDYDELRKSWCEQCPRMMVILERLKGIRVTRQDPWECLISFICSSNNNIIRISQMLDKLRIKYGEYICSIYFNPESQEWNYTHDIKSVLNCDSVEHFYQFPTPQRLAEVSEDELRSLGVGYRAKFIIDTSKFVLKKEAEVLSSTDSKYNKFNGLWFKRLRDYKFEAFNSKSNVDESTTFTESSESPPKPSRLYVQDELTQLPGVGRKVADCVGLFSLDQQDAIPVDTHIWSITIRDYAPNLKFSTKSLTPTVYETIGDVFRNRFGPTAGWAHSVLFAAELPQFRALLPMEMQSKMKDFSDEQRNEKRQKKTNAALKTEAKKAKAATEQSPSKGSKRSKH